MDEYIKRESAIEAIMSDPPDAHYQSWYAEKIKAIPAADVAPVRPGRWVKSRGELCTIKCSTCREEWYFECDDDVFDLNYHYCPNSGAKMDEVIE